MTLALDHQIIYPDSDEQPMVANTEQFEWIVSSSAEVCGEKKVEDDDH